ncbi:hypothetical protein SCUCBS95973_001337 [Sporothrix curviconia]|uniref:Uncharacterized protein n=1 Tax=Sporothrix curviconia TaxID=1260050 RepID=A0ABP0AYC3_9PEZI
MTLVPNIKALSEAGISDKDMRNMAAAWLSYPAGDNVDIDKFTVLAGYSNATNARKRFGEVKKCARALVFGNDSKNSKNSKNNESGESSEKGEHAGDGSVCGTNETPEIKPVKKGKHSITNTASAKRKIEDGGPASKRVKGGGSGIESSKANDTKEEEIQV